MPIVAIAALVLFAVFCVWGIFLRLGPKPVELPSQKPTDYQTPVTPVPYDR